MEYDAITKLMESMANSKLTEVNIDFPDGTKVSMKKGNENLNKEYANEEKVVPKQEIKEVKQETSLDTKIVKSPMVGTFYLKPTPNSKPYVEVGETIEKGETLCIIEAMKLMNDIESEFSGKIEEILVKDGDMVEYGTPLFRIGE